MYGDIKWRCKALQAREMAELIAANWKQALLDEGMSASEARSYEDAFVHVEAERAQAG